MWCACVVCKCVVCMCGTVCVSYVHGTSHTKKTVSHCTFLNTLIIICHGKRHTYSITVTWHEVYVILSKLLELVFARQSGQILLPELRAQRSRKLHCSSTYGVTLRHDNETAPNLRETYFWLKSYGLLHVGVCAQVSACVSPHLCPGRPRIACPPATSLAGSGWNPGEQGSCSPSVRWRGPPVRHPRGSWGPSGGPCWNDLCLPVPHLRCPVGWCWNLSIWEEVGGGGRGGRGREGREGEGGEGGGGRGGRGREGEGGEGGGGREVLGERYVGDDNGVHVCTHLP